MSSKLLTKYVRSLLAGLKDHGVVEVVVSPGSRSTPLAYGVVSDPDFNVSIQVDERSAGFYALGLAKANHQPVALICTSGSAAANYFPAIVEAYYARIPLIVLTADRPHELRQVGAPQTIDQVKLYGDHVKWSFDFPLADEHPSTNRFVYQQVGRGIRSALALPKGPVQFNVPFREPLLIDFDEAATPKKVSSAMDVEVQLSEEQQNHFENLIAHAKRGIVVAGEIPIAEREGVMSFLKQLKWPVLSDPLSNLRSTDQVEVRELVVENYDSLLKDSELYEDLRPDIVIRIGAQPVSKFLGIFLQQHPPESFLVVDEHANYRDSYGLVTDVFQVPAGALTLRHSNEVPHDTRERWFELNSFVRHEVAAYIQFEQDEGAYVGSLLQALPEDSVLFASSSMPIRDVDTFFQVNDKNHLVFANRGTNGIDGVLSTALGVQKSIEKPLYLVIGDLAMLHDSNGLLLSRYQQVEGTIIVLNNDGGGIFSYLPQSSDTTYFEKLFGTASGLGFKHLAEMYHIPYEEVSSKERFVQMIEQPFTGLRIIEVKTNRSHNTKSHRDFWNRVKEGRPLHDH